jgi:uncharacterized repeat protein (TIGR03803 family)
MSVAYTIGSRRAVDSTAMTESRKSSAIEHDANRSDKHMRRWRILMTLAGASLLLTIPQAQAQLLTLHNFAGRSDGSDPSAALMQANPQFLFGTTLEGGMYGYGTLFKMTPAGTLTKLHDFTGGDDGAGPRAALVKGPRGDWYGTASYGGANNNGTIFEINSAEIFTTAHEFEGGDGGSPQAALVPGAHGDLYGTTVSGGNKNYGTVFKISPAGMLTTLYSFTGGSDGGNPGAALVKDCLGDFYGTTTAGGAQNSGTVFKITPAGALTTLYSFSGGIDGGNPSGGLARVGGNEFYGTTSSGGANNYGTVFKITPEGILTMLHQFTGGADGGAPLAGLVRGPAGALYGTTYAGGASARGTIFKMTLAGRLTTLYSFTGGADGAYPNAALVVGSNGKLYGTTSEGGSNSMGTVFVFPCPSSISPMIAAIRLSGGSGIVWVKTPGYWTATSDVSWITVVCGPDEVSYTVGTNDTGAARIGTITVAGKTFTVKQPGTSTGQPGAGTGTGGGVGVFDGTYDVTVSSWAPGMPTQTGTATITVDNGHVSDPTGAFNGTVDANGNFQGTDNAGAGVIFDMTGKFYPGGSVSISGGNSTAGMSVTGQKA